VVPTGKGVGEGLRSVICKMTGGQGKVNYGCDPEKKRVRRALGLLGGGGIRYHWKTFGVCQKISPSEKKSRKNQEA